MKNKKVFYGWFVVAGCIILNAMGTGIFSSIMGLFFPSIVEEFGYSQAQVAGIVSIAIVGGLLATGVFSKLYSKYSAKKLVLIFGLLQGASYALMSQANSLTMMYVIGALMGIAGMGATALSAPMLITRWFDKNRGTAMGIAVAGAGLGPALMAPVVTSVISNSGHRIAFIVLGAIIAASMIVAFILIKDTPEEMGLKPFGQNEGDISKSKDDTKTVKTEEAYSYNLKEAVKTKMFYGLTLFIVIICTVVQGLLVQIPSYLNEVGLDASKVGMIVGAYALVAGFGKMLIGWVYDNVGVFKANFIFFTFMILSFASLLMVPTNESFVYLYVVLAGMGLGLAPVAIPLLVSILFGSKHYAAIYPVFMLLMSVGAVIGGIVAGIIIDSSGYSALLVSAIVGALLALVTIQITVKIADKTKNKIKKPQLEKKIS